MIPYLDISYLLKSCIFWYKTYWNKVWLLQTYISCNLFERKHDLPIVQFFLLFGILAWGNSEYYFLNFDAVAYLYWYMTLYLSNAVWGMQIFNKPFRIDLKLLLHSVFSSNFIFKHFRPSCRKRSVTHFVSCDLDTFCILNEIFLALIEVEF